MLLVRTRCRLLMRAGKYPVIVRKNPAIRYSWLTKFATGHIANPTVRRLQDLIMVLDWLDAQDKKPARDSLASGRNSHSPVQ